ncbi:hypothetical protein ACVXHB_13675 [Escherichia coli]
MDMNHIPDAAMTIATAALFAKGTTTLRNIYNWRVKETDRLFAMATNCVKSARKWKGAPLHSYHSSGKTELCRDRDIQ